MAGGTTAEAPFPISMDGMISDHTDAATMTPDANPSRTFCTTDGMSRFIKKTKADPSAVPRKGINKVAITGLILLISISAKFGKTRQNGNPYF